MNRQLQTLLAVVCGCAVVGSGFGCEDADARRRAEVQQQIADAREQFQRASLGSAHPDDEHAQQMESDLNRIVSSLSALTDGEPGQQAAKSLLTAEALRELSLITYRHIHDIESEHRVARQSIQNRLTGLKRLAAVRQARESVTAEQHLASLAQMRQTTQQQLRHAQRQLEEIREPIAEIIDRNERDRETVDELRDQAMELMRQAEELGPADGFETFEKAIRLEREADLIEFRTSHRELELTLEHQPVESLTDRQIRAAEALQESIQSAIHDLEAFDELYASAASKLRNRINTGRDQLREQVQRISSSMKGELSKAYQEATDYQERAAREAGQAVTRLRGDEVNAARLIQARINETIGRLYHDQAGGVSDHLALLAAIVASPNAVGDVQPFQAEIQQLTEQHEMLLSQAKDAYAQAKGSLDMISGAAAQQVAGYRQNIEMLLSAMEGRAVDVWQRDVQPPVDDRPAPAPAEVDAASADGDGFDSAEALVAFLRGMDETSTSDTERMMATIRAESRLGQAFTSMMNSMTRAMVELMTAIEEQFGTHAVRQLSEAAGGGAGFTNLTIDSQTATRAVVRHEPTPAMPDGTIELINVDGRWFIDGDSLVADEMRDPQMEEMGLAMLQQMGQAMTQQVGQLTQRVRAGEFDSIEEFMELMMQMMQGGPGGPGGPGAPGGMPGGRR